MNSALIVVDVQRDFCEGGKLAVVGGNRVASAIKYYILESGHFYDTVIFTKDNHNPWPDTNGGHFSMNPDFVDSWPVHCETLSDGWKFNPDISIALDIVIDQKIDHSVFFKGMGRPDYSGFQAENVMGESLHKYLTKHGISDIDVCGIAGDYCVKATALDGKKLGFVVNISTNLTASVGGPEATKQAIDTLNRA